MKNPVTFLIAVLSLFTMEWTYADEAFEKAAASFKKGREIYQSFRDLGPNPSLKVTREKLKGAAEAFEESLQNYNHSKTAYFLCVIYAELGSDEKAGKYAALALRIDPKLEADYRKAAQLVRDWANGEADPKSRRSPGVGFKWALISGKSVPTGLPFPEQGL
jgi:tetratricopeptide (TPR) repeat protein